MKRCPNCGTTTTSHRQDEYWRLVESYERLASDTGAIQDLVELAKRRLDQVVTTVTSSAVPERHLAYEDHYSHVRAAERLLNRVSEIRNQKGGEL